MVAVSCDVVFIGEAFGYGPKARAERASREGNVDQKMEDKGNKPAIEPKSRLEVTWRHHVSFGIYLHLVVPEQEQDSRACTIQPLDFLSFPPLGDSLSALPVPGFHNIAADI